MQIKRYIKRKKNEIGLYFIIESYFKRITLYYLTIINFLFKIILNSGYIILIYIISRYFEKLGGINCYDKRFLHGIKDRRSYYGINKEVQVSDEKIKEIVEFAVKYTPSAFNSQTARLVVLTGEAHDKLWDITTETLRKVVGEGISQELNKKWIPLKLDMGQYYSLKMKL